MGDPLTLQKDFFPTETGEGWVFTLCDKILIAKVKRRNHLSYLSWINLRVNHESKIIRSPRPII